MFIRLFERSDESSVKDIMAGNPLAFPGFVIGRYPGRWNHFLAGSDDKQCGYYVMDSENKGILGHAGYLHSRDEGLYEIVGAAVKNGYQGRGIGRALIETICDKVSGFGEPCIILYTLDHPGMEPTLAFYGSLGFECASHEKDYFAPGYHRVKFIRNLLYG
jgi:GNAT superfamily N-acetyltransferase